MGRFPIGVIIDSFRVAIPEAVRLVAKRTDEPIDIIDIIGSDSPLAGAVRQ